MQEEQQKKTFPLLKILSEVREEVPVWCAQQLQFVLECCPVVMGFPSLLAGLGLDRWSCLLAVVLLACPYLVVQLVSVWFWLGLLLYIYLCVRVVV